VAERGDVPNVSVVLCTYNRAEGLAVVLDALERQTGLERYRWEVLVVDNNSTDGTRAVVERKIATGRLALRYTFEGIQGKSRAMNRGIDETTAPIVAFTDDDVTIPEGWLAALLAPFDDPECAGVGGAVKAYWEAEVPRWASESEPYRMMGGIVQYSNPAAYGPVVAPPIGANCAYRREMFRKHGVFRLDLGHSGNLPIPGEDIEFGLRLQHAGENLIFTRAAEVLHPVTRSRLTRSYFERWYFQRGRLEPFLAEYELSPDIPRIAGIPRYLLRELPTWVARWLTTFDPRGRFYYKLRTCMAAGAIREFYRWRGGRAA
jgi:glycosyltransferase involved in cell wall biosynthesis